MLKFGYARGYIGASVASQLGVLTTVLFFFFFFFFFCLFVCFDKVCPLHLYFKKLLGIQQLQSYYLQMLLYMADLGEMKHPEIKEIG